MDNCIDERYGQSEFFNECAKKDKNNTKRMIQYIERHPTFELDLNAGLWGACKAGNMELAKYLIEHKATRVYEMYGAFNNVCISGNLELVHYIYSRGVTNLNWGLFTASYSGH